ncbi:MAG TPA: DUF2917 domain-containing protein [Spirochaetia bacterium]|nr:DUF2917 domain-containing protein [Spirochaetia bacterium]
MRSFFERNPSTLVLARGELVSLQPRGRPCSISCVAGRLWVTAAGSREDCVLLPGNSMTVRKRGRIVVEALRTATVRLEIRAAARAPAPAAFSGRPVPSARLPLPSI